MFIKNCRDNRGQSVWEYVFILAAITMIVAAALLILGPRIGN